jgi:hypothetical protein
VTAFRLVIIVGCVTLLMGGGYMSWYGVGRTSGDLTAAAPSVRAGSVATGALGGYGFFGRVK